MGELNTAAPKNKSGTKKRKEHSTRVDLTPMVDLGFLLITFFIFTTSLSEPTAMKLTLPDNSPTVSPMKAAEQKTLHLILGANRTCWIYAGADRASITATTSLPEIRRTIQSKRKDVIRQYGNAKEFIVLIKPTEQARYEDLVNALDEMTLNAVARYILMEPSEEERAVTLLE